MSDDGQQTGRIREIGNCEVLAKVGQGGMGTVFRARQKSLDRIVALKVLPPSIAKDASFIERFQREARASAKFSHPHIVNGIDVGQDAATGLWFFVMEFVDGPSLKDVQKQRVTLPEGEVLKLARQIASALDCLAAHGMVHRDIKPDNIMLNERGDAKLADLGLAKDTRDDSHLTQSGNAVGTPYYMSPEQVRGEVAGIDIRADIYALGATLFHLLTGRPPFQGETSAVIMSKHLTEAVPMANKIHTGITEGCARMIVRMMQKKKEERIQTPRELIDIIDKVLAGEYGMTTSGRSPVRGTGPRQPVKNKSVREEKPGRKWMPLAALGALALLGVVAALVFSGKDTPVAKNDAPANTKPAPAAVTAPPAAPKNPAPAAPKNPAPQPAGPAVARQAATQIEAVRKYENEHPNAFDEALRRYKEIATRAASTPMAAEVNAAVEKAVEQLEARRLAAAAETWKDLEARSMAASNGGDIDSALEVLTNVPEAFAEVLKERVETRAAKLHDDARMRIEIALKAAEDSIARAEPQTGLEALAEIESTRYQPLAESVKAMKERLTADLANAADLKKRREIRDARAKLAEHLTRFEKALLDDRNLPAARGLADEIARDTRLAPIEDEAKALNGLVAAHEDYLARTLDAFEPLKGRSIKINKDEGVLLEVKDGVLSLKIPGPGGSSNFGVKKIKVADLTEAQRKELLKVEWADTPAARVAAAMTRMREPEDLAGAAVLLADATDFPLHAIYDERLQIRLKGAEEVAAEKAFAALETAARKPAASPEQAIELLTQVSQFEKAHGTSKIARAKELELRALRASLEKASTVNLLKNGDFESSDLATGACPSWNKETPNEWGPSGRYKHAGGTSYLMPNNGRLFQDTELEVGTTYRLTAKVSGAGMCKLDCSIYSVGLENAAVSKTVSFIGGEPQNGTVWKPMELIFTPGAARVRVLFEKSTGSGISLLDDVVLARVLPGAAAAVAAAEPAKPAKTPAMPPVPPAVAAAKPAPPAAPQPNLIQNGGFEAGAEPWKLTRAILQTEDSHAGRVHVLLQNKGSVACQMKTEPGFVYAVTCWIHGKGYLYLQVDRADSGYKYAEEDNGWIKAVYKFTATAASHTVELAARGGAYAVDEISVVKGDAAVVTPDAALAAQLPPDFHVHKGHIYKLFKDQVSWIDAKKACEKMGGHLLFVDSEDENIFASKLAQGSGKDVWIGLYDPQGLSQWVWSDGRKMTYNGFSEKGIYKRQTPRAARYAQFVGFDWAEDPIEKLYYFICEWDTLPEKFAKKPAAGPAPVAEKKKTDE